MMQEHDVRLHYIHLYNTINTEVQLPALSQLLTKASEVQLTSTR